MRRKVRKWSTLTPGKRMGFSRLVPSILLRLVSVVWGANIASKGVPGTLKPFLRTLKSVFSTFWKDDVVIVSSCEDRGKKRKKTKLQIRQFGSRSSGQYFRRWVPPEPEIHLLKWDTTPCQKRRGRVWLRHQAAASRLFESSLPLPMKHTARRTECNYLLSKSIIIDIIRHVFEPERPLALVEMRSRRIYWSGQKYKNRFLKSVWQWQLEVSVTTVSFPSIFISVWVSWSWRASVHCAVQSYPCQKWYFLHYLIRIQADAVGIKSLITWNFSKKTCGLLK